MTAAVALGVIATIAGCSGGKGTTNNGPAATHLLSQTKDQYGTLPAAQGPAKHGGTVTYGIINGETPNWILPITPDANYDTVNSNFQTPMYLPLLTNQVSDRPEISYPDSLMNAPVYSDGNKTVAITMKPGYTWADGAPVDAQDVLFFIDIVKQAVKESAANFGAYSPGDFPDDVVSASAPSKFTLVLHLSHAYNPAWFTDTQLIEITPMPSTTWAKSSAGGSQLDYSNPANAKAIWDFLQSQAKDKPTYATNPLWQDVDGPFKLTSYTTSTAENVQSANAKYTGPHKPYVAAIKAEYFASSTAEVNQLRAGTLDIGNVDSADIPQIPTLEKNGYHVWGYPDLGFQYLVFNFKDTTDAWNDIIGQLYIRQALAHLQNQAAMIKGVYDNAAVPAYGPVPPVPTTPFTPANAQTNPYPFSIADASHLLSSHGWHVVPDGTTTCTDPGSGPTECGAGIPKGANLNFTCYYSPDPSSIGEQVSSVASEAKQVGINITPVSKTFDFIIDQYDDPVTPSQDDHWAAEDYGGFTLGDYPTTDTIFNTGGDDNEGDWSDKTADKLIDNSKFSANPAAIRQEASYITKELPALFQPAPDGIIAWHGVSGPPDSFANITQFGWNPQYWWVTGS